MKYPEEIYATRDGGSFAPEMRSSIFNVAWGRRHAYKVGYEAGKAEQSNYIESMSSLESVLTDVEQLEGEDLPFVKRLIERTVRAVRAEQPDPLAGYSNLTAAISAGEPIDYEKLEGRFAKCVHPELPTPLPIGILQVHNESELRTPTGWREPIDSFGTVRRYVLMHSWWGDYDWVLWVEGDIPLVRKTADQLELGTYFWGKTRDSYPCQVYVGCAQGNSAVKTVHHAPTMFKSTTPATEWEVLEEYGPFRKPEEKK